MPPPTTPARPHTLHRPQLILSHAHGDGTAALKAAHPGGVKFIKHKLTAAEHATAYKGDLDPATVPRLIPLAELARHNTPADCWLAIDGRVCAIRSPLSPSAHPNS